MKLDTKRILVISDLHLPVQHPDALKFLKKVRDNIEPTLVVSIGDLLDQAALSFFEKNPNLPNASGELEQSRKAVKEFYQEFPDMIILRGNHDLRLRNRAYKAELPDDYIRDFPDLLNSPSNWIWRRDLRLNLPTGEELYMAHDVGRSLKKAVASRAMCIVGGHYHSKMKITYFSNHYSLNWGMNVGCLVNDKHPAFDYMRNSSGILTKERSLLGTGAIIDGRPLLVPMRLNKQSRWSGKI